MAAGEEGDLGFTWRAVASGAVVVSRHGRPVTILRGAVARSFLAAAEGVEPSAIQQRLARLTGNYRRGNERATSGRRPRDR